MPTFSIITLGCKVNQYESDLIERILETAHWTPFRHSEKSDLSEPIQVDVCIINTCTVTQKSAMQSRQAIRQAVRANPGARIIVTGCYAQTEPDAIRQINGVHDIIGNTDKHLIPEMLITGLYRIIQDYTGLYSSSFIHKNRTRQFLKIQDGCNAFCSYCIVPYARGASRSMKPEDVIKNIQAIKNAGYREVVLTGIHLGCYGLDLVPKTSLAELLKLICNLKPIDRIRLSSIEPNEINGDIIDLAAESDIICHHFHIPLQSGDNNILKKMGRHYTREFFKSLILSIRESIPDAAIGVDSLIGFPGETDRAFENTFDIIQNLPVSYLHVFPFSARKGTPAFHFQDKVPSQIIKLRCENMRSLSRQKRQDFYNSFVGTPFEALIQKPDRHSGMITAMTSNYIPVLIKSKHPENTMIRIIIENVTVDNLVFGRVLNE